METDGHPPIEHQNVPSNHQSLHEFLYSSDDEHAAKPTTPQPVLGNGSEITPLATWLAAADKTKIAGVYAVLDEHQHTQYIHYSRNVPLSLKSHLTANGPQTCAFVRVEPFKYPKRTEMEVLKNNWIAELPKVPPGNAGESSTWASTVQASSASVLSEEEQQVYEDKKLKLRKAMADGTLKQDTKAVSASTKSVQLRTAMEGDDWSALIDGQTQETTSK